MIKVVEYARKVKPFERGELDITLFNEMYLKDNNLSVELLRRGFSWLDTGTHDSLIEAESFVETIQKRQRMMVTCPEESVWRNGGLSDDDTSTIVNKSQNNECWIYLSRLLKNTNNM